MIEIDAKRCNACGFCEDVCPTGAITVNGDCARIDANLCTGCGSCVDACPRNAIRERIPQRIAATASGGASNQGRDVKQMYGRGMVGSGRGRGRGFGYGMGMGYGRGMGFGRGFGFGRGLGLGRGLGRGMGRGFGRGWFDGGWGRGNPYAYCRFSPWLPRRRWDGPNAGYYGMPYDDPYSYRDWQATGGDF